MFEKTVAVVGLLACGTGRADPQEIYHQLLGATAATSLSDGIGSSALSSSRLATGS